MVSSVLLLTVVWGLMLGCGGAKLNSAWTNQPISVDGDDSDWINLPRTYFEDAGVSIAFANNQDYLWVMIRKNVNGRGPGADLVSLWFDPTGKKKKEFSFDYRMINTNRPQDIPGGMPPATDTLNGNAGFSRPPKGGMDQSDMSDNQKFGGGAMPMGATMKPLQETENQIIYRPGEGERPEIITMNDDAGVKAAIATFKGVGIFEFCIALGEGDEEFSLLTALGEKFSIGINSTSMPSMSRGGGGPGGGGRGGGGGVMGGGPGGGAPPGGGSMPEASTNTDWIVVKLAAAETE